MKKPERLIGFIRNNDIDFPFKFDEKAFSIMLFPPTREIWEEYTSPVKLFESILPDVKKHEWIQQNELWGITAEGYKIVFNVQDVPTRYYGFINYDINWYLCHTDSMAIDKICGFRILGHDVNLFYPPQIALESKFEINEDGRGFENISVTSNKQQFESCGKYFVGEKIEADIAVKAFASFHSDTSDNPIDATSCMITTFSVPVGISTLIDAYCDVRHFFQYITYRKNVDIGDLDLFSQNEKGFRDYSGILVFPTEHEKESHKKLHDRIIPYRILGKNSASIFTAIRSNVLGFRHLCDSIDNMRHYLPSRIIMILSAFEREFRNIYGQDLGRSDEYLEAKNEIITLIGSYSESNHGQKRRYAKQIKKYVENRDSSFESNLEYALNDCHEILIPFITRRYAVISTDIIHEISSRMGDVRNGIAHCRLDMDFDPIHLDDIPVVEELLYVIRLKESHLSILECKKAINLLFGWNFTF